MEPDVKAFLIIIVQTIFTILVWLMLNVYFGVKKGLMFLDGKITWWHGLYYILMVASLIWVVRYIVKKWKQMPEFKEEHE